MLNTKKRVVLSVVLLALFATATTGGFSVFYILNIIKENTRNYLSQNAKSYSHELNGEIIGIEVTVDSLIKTVLSEIDKSKLNDKLYYYALSEKLETIVSEYDENDINAMSIYIRFDPDLSYGVAGVFHADTNGDGTLESLVPTDITLYDKTDREHVAWFYEPIEARSPIWTDPYYNANVDIDMISYISPIEIDGKIIGVAGIDINFNQLRNITMNRKDPGEVTLVDKSYKFLVHDKYGIDDRIDTIDNSSLSYIADEVSDNEYGVIEYKLDDVEKVLGYSKLKNGWTVLVSLSQTEAFIKLNSIILFLLAINTIITVFVIVIALFTARYLTTLINRNVELEIMVNERTKELINTNEYLEISMAELENSQAELMLLNDQLESSIIQVKNMQEKIVMTEKLSSLGELVTSIAHELNTPLGISVTSNSYILSKLEEIRKSYEASTLSKNDFKDCLLESVSAVKITEKALNQMADLINVFKQVTLNKSILDIKKINFKEYLKSIVIENKYKLMEGRHEIHLICDDELEFITYPVIMKHLFNQLISNSIIHGFEDRKDKNIYIEISKKNHHIEIIYSDDGRGISKEILKRIFEPFYTTKKNKGNVGLGLHIIHNLISKTLNGSIEFLSEENEGVRFIITFSEII